jgi:hypothetical protein
MWEAFPGKPPNCFSLSFEFGFEASAGHRDKREGQYTWNKLQGEETLAREALGEISFFLRRPGKDARAPIVHLLRRLASGPMFFRFGAAGANAFGPFGHNLL